MAVVWNLRLPTLFLIVSFCSFSISVAQAKKEPNHQCSDTAKEFYLRAGALYAHQKMLEKAEKEYLSAGESVCPTIRQQALDGLEQIQGAASDNELELGRFYEGQGLWTEAEAHFSKSAESSAIPQTRRAAIDGIWRVRDAQSPHLHRLIRYTDFIPTLGSLFARLAVSSLVLWILLVVTRAVIGRWRALVPLPFNGEKEFAEKIAVAFPAVRARVASLVAPGGQVFLPEVVQIVFPFVSPSLGELLPEEAFELAGMKIPNLSKFLGLIARPRFEVRGGVLKGDVTHLLYAEVWRRRMWFGSILATSVTREIPIQGPQGAELESFIYDIYLSAHASL